MSEHSHGLGGAWALTQWSVPGCPACQAVSEGLLHGTQLRAERAEAQLADAWEQGYVAGYAFGHESAQDTYGGPLEDPTPNPYGGDA